MPCSPFPAKGSTGSALVWRGLLIYRQHRNPPHFNLRRHLPQALLFFLLLSFYSSPLRESLRALLSFISFPSVLSYFPSTTTHRHHGCSLRNLARYVNQLPTRPLLGLPLTNVFFVPLPSLRRLQVLRSPIPDAASVTYLDDSQPRHDP
jgi:hypothetical protein